MLQDEKKRALVAAIINEEAKAATALLKKRKREIEDAEAVLQAKHAIKNFCNIWNFRDNLNSS